mgnify:CR=1 FL=1
MIIPFIKIYTAGITDANYIRREIVILFTVMGLLNCLRTPSATMINAKGHYNETKNRALIEMTICLIAQALLVTKLGIVGVLIGTIMAYLYRTLDVILYGNKNKYAYVTLKNKYNDFKNQREILGERERLFPFFFGRLHVFVQPGAFFSLLLKGGFL